jgi:hypothetical protein
LRNEAILALAAETVVLCLAEGFYGAEVRALDCGLVAIDVAERIMGIDQGGGDSTVIVDTGRGADSVTVFVGPDVEIHCGGFDTAGAKEAPVVYRDEVDEHELGSIGGLIAFDRGLTQVLIGLLVFVREDGDFRRHAVRQRVEFRLCFSFRSFGAGGFLSIPAVCFDLFLCCHPDCRVQGDFGEKGLGKFEMIGKEEDKYF